MVIVRSDAQIDVFTLARNAGTSVDQIERFYAKRLPISPERAKNLQHEPTSSRVIEQYVIGETLGKVGGSDLVWLEPAWKKTDR